MHFKIKHTMITISAPSPYECECGSAVIPVCVVLGIGAPLIGSGLGIALYLFMKPLTGWPILFKLDINIQYTCTYDYHMFSFVVKRYLWGLALSDIKSLPCFQAKYLPQYSLENNIHSDIKLHF